MKKTLLHSTIVLSLLSSSFGFFGPVAPALAVKGRLQNLLSKKKPSPPSTGHTNEQPKLKPTPYVLLKPGTAYVHLVTNGDPRIEPSDPTQVKYGQIQLWHGDVNKLSVNGVDNSEVTIPFNDQHALQKLLIATSGAARDQFSNWQIQKENDPGATPTIPSHLHTDYLNKYITAYQPKASDNPNGMSLEEKWGKDGYLPVPNHSPLKSNLQIHPTLLYSWASGSYVFLTKQGNQGVPYNKTLAQQLQPILHYNSTKLEESHVTLHSDKYKHKYYFSPNISTQEMHSRMIALSEYMSQQVPTDGKNTIYGENIARKLYPDVNTQLVHYPQYNVSTSEGNVTTNTLNTLEQPQTPTGFVNNNLSPFPNGGGAPQPTAAVTTAPTPTPPTPTPPTPAPPPPAAPTTPPTT